MTVRTSAYERLALEDPEGLWELWCGTPRKKPAMTFQHDNVIEVLEDVLKGELPTELFAVRVHPVRLLAPSGSYYIPDLCVIPRPVLRAALIAREVELSVIAEPLPLVVEVWSPSTGRRDRTVKLADFRARGDGVIWLIHPLRRTLTAWERGPDGSYTQSVYQGSSTVAISTLPGVTVHLDELFAPA